MLNFGGVVSWNLYGWVKTVKKNRYIVTVKKVKNNPLKKQYAT